MIEPGVPSGTMRPVDGLIDATTRLGGGTGSTTGTFSSAVRMKLIQIGSAARPPYSPRPRLLKSSLPTQTVVTRSPPKPENHASR